MDFCAMDGGTYAQQLSVTFAQILSTIFVSGSFDESVGDAS